jgi:fatty-acyl-CoA synthase
MADLWTELFARSGPTLHVIAGDRIEPWPVARLMRHGERAAAGLIDRGVQPGTPVASIITNSPEACATVIGTWLAGATVVSLPVIARATTVPDYRDQLLRICADAKSPLLLVEARYAPFLEGLGVPVVTHEELPAERGASADPPPEDEVAFVQYSSGSTRSPRGCALSTRAIAAQLDLLAGALELDPERDRGLAWLPLSHDMGLFGGLMNFWRAGVDGMLTTPERFLAAPRTWLEDCAEFGATLTVAPALGLAMASRAARTAPPDRKLRLRACIVGGDMLYSQTLQTVDEVLGPIGLGASQVVPAYGLAEATLAVTMGPLGSPPNACPSPLVDADEALPVVSAGRPLPGVDVTIDGDEGVGEILVRSPSLASGYVNDEPATAEAFRDGVLHTGDVGFIHDGELYPVARTDDVIKVGGRKIWATDVEAAVEADGGVRPGNCVLVAVPGSTGQRLVVLLEPDDEAGRPEVVARRVGRRALEDGAVGIDECVLVRRGSLPKTPSGKLQRYRCRQIAQDGGESVVARVTLRQP